MKIPDTCSCGGQVAPDITGRPMCYRCGPVQLRDPELRAAQEAAVREHQWEHKGPVLAVAQMAKAPGKMIARSDIIAILRAQRGISGSVVDAEYDRLISIFSNVE